MPKVLPIAKRLSIVWKVHSKSAFSNTQVDNLKKPSAIRINNRKTYNTSNKFIGKSRSDWFLSDIHVFFM